MLKDNKLPVALIKSHDTPELGLRGGDDANTGLQRDFLCSIGTRVMLRANLWVEGGLVNGAIGTVREIAYLPMTTSPELPAYILVEFDNFKGPYIGNKCFPVLPIVRSTNHGNSTFSRKQYPLTVSYAATVHKSQGLTLSKVAVDLGPKELCLGISYVALSRVRKLEDLLLLTTYPKSRIDRIFNLPSHKLKMEYMENWN